jgi:hypothetical protein
MEIGCTKGPRTLVKLWSTRHRQGVNIIVGETLWPKSVRHSHHNRWRGRRAGLLSAEEPTRGDREGWSMAIVLRETLRRVMRQTQIAGGPVIQG